MATKMTRRIAEPRTAFKLLTLHKDGSVGSLFIHRRNRLTVGGEMLPAENHPTKGYAERMGWHCCRTPEAPHLSPKGRVWAEVVVADYVEVERPECQGGTWLLANQMRVVRLLDEPVVEADESPTDLFAGRISFKVSA
jgi:hypothetical protein